MSLNKDLQTVIDGVEKESGFSFAKHTTYGCGGVAKEAYYPKTIEQAAAVYDYIKLTKKNFVTLGNGSNVLAADGGFDGVVIATKFFQGIEQKSADSILCYAGTTAQQILKYCKTHGLGGLEYIVGIPATCGGLVYMNGGAGGMYISNNVKSVLIYDGEFKTLTNKSCQFGNKHSIMRDIDCMILAAEFSLAPKSAEDIEWDIEYYLSKRRMQPKGKSCGCVFKNTSEVSAGKLIDDLGLKGLSRGSAAVSSEHANFILNSGTCSSDVYALIKEVKSKVLEKTGILLEEEVVYIGDFNDSFG
ncbi:MAG: UDP-N-acetylmuramate dehydrogenase [Clostridia bacterium]|nr:UDP-N-acetylmuramate dehydrogenase [Clostridia bacterium]